MKTALLAMAITAMLGLGGCLSGCSNGDRNPFELAEQAKALGVKARITAIWGTGHAGGFAYNFSGSNGFIEITVDPTWLSQKGSINGSIKVYDTGMIRESEHGG